jgi:hypothetical protein
MNVPLCNREVKAQIVMLAVWVVVFAEVRAGNRGESRGPDHASPPKTLSPTAIVTGDSNAPKVAELLCAVADGGCLLLRLHGRHQYVPVLQDGAQYGSKLGIGQNGVADAE